jgi:small-conductance mechanosensitive channel
MEQLRSAFERVRDALDIPLITLGESELTLWSLIYLVFLIVLLVTATRIVRRVLEHRVLSRSRLDSTERQAVASVFQYTIIAIGILIIVQTAGIDLTTLNILAGAIGIGVGFGLQNIANNFISGLIILFEKPIKLGDRIEVADVEGDVVRIGARSTTVLTNDNIAIIVPNSRFISENVINWSYNDEKVRFRIPVGVAYASDVQLVEKLMVEAAQENPDVLDHPEPAVRLIEFGNSGLIFELRAWTSALLHRRGTLVSALNLAILEKFRAHDVEIPFPQRDLHIRTGRVEMESDG